MLWSLNIFSMPCPLDPSLQKDVVSLVVACSRMRGNTVNLSLYFSLKQRRSEHTYLCKKKELKMSNQSKSYGNSKPVDNPVNIKSYFWDNSLKMQESAFFTV